jgi:hypothetical protein
VHDKAGRPEAGRLCSAITKKEDTLMGLDLVILFFLILVWRKVCIFLSDPERIDRFHKWFPFTKYPRWKRWGKYPRKY